MPHVGTGVEDPKLHWVEVAVRLAFMHLLDLNASLKCTHGFRVHLLPYLTGRV